MNQQILFVMRSLDNPKLFSEAEKEANKVEVSMHIKEIYRIWEATGFKDNDLKKSFERAINTRAVIALIIEANRLRDNLEETNDDLYLEGENYLFWASPELVPLPKEEPEAIDKGAKYLVTMRNRHTGESIEVDVYDVLEAFKITCSALAHALKKLLMAGRRGVKDFNKDCDEAVNSVEQAKLLQKHRKD